MKTILYISLTLNLAAGVYLGRKVYQRYRAETGETTPLPSHFYYNWTCDVFRARPTLASSIVFVGDSHTAHFGVSEFFGPHVLNRGINMDTVGGVLSRIKEVTSRKPRKIFLQIGINDLGFGIDPEHSKTLFVALLDSIKKTSPTSKVYIQSLFPTVFKPTYYGNEKGVVKQTNQFLKTLAQARQLTYIDVYSHLQQGDTLAPQYDCGDRLHLSAKGYAVWAEAVKGFVLNDEL